ncbi:hypothetical protein [Serratia liquefaciens]|uniref:hypothetical protein n=1 Tax=Serratia liquefaciens TaxID=614 RepID=UPI0021C5B126|nr:hypothetical protein [Serratia liquefaciens]
MHAQSSGGLPASGKIKTRIYTYNDLKSHEKTKRSIFTNINREFLREGNDLHSFYRKPAGDAFFVVIRL